jgi:iron complex outermembrane receptor protein
VNHQPDNPPSSAHFLSVKMLVLICAGPVLGAQTAVLPSLVIVGDKLTATTRGDRGATDVLLPSSAAAPTRGTYQDLLAMVPGAYEANANAGLFSLRGLNQDDLFGGLGTGSNALVAVLADGIPLSSATLRFLPPTLWGLAGAEVLRGPQSLSHGPNSLGGALLLHRRQPEFSAQGEALVERAAFGSWRTGLAQDLPLRKEELTLRLTGLRQQSDGAEFNRFNADPAFGATERTDLGTTLLWRPGRQQDQVFQLSLQHEKSDGNPFANVTDAVRGDLFQRETSLNTPPDYAARRRAATLQTSLALPHRLRLRAVTGVQHFAADSLADLDGASRLSWFNQGLKEERRATGDVTLARPEGRIRWLLGAYAERSTYALDYTGVGLAPLPRGSAFAHHATETVAIAALYGRADYALRPDLHLNGGVRHNGENRDLTASSVFGALPRKTAGGHTSEADWLPQVSLQWQPSPGRSVALKWSRGYRSGGTSFAPFVGLVRDYQPEYAAETELAVRLALTPTLHLNAALFHAAVQDQQVPVAVPGGFPGIDHLLYNTGTTRRSGAEVALVAPVTPAFAFTGSVSWLQSRFGPLAIGHRDVSGQALPNAPRWTASWGFDYKRPAGWFGSARFSVASGAYSQVASARVTALEPRRLLSARLGYTWRRVRLYAYGANLLDEHYALYRSDNTALGLPVSGQAGLPRQLGGGAELRW